MSLMYAPESIGRRAMPIRTVLAYNQRKLGFRLWADSGHLGYCYGSRSVGRSVEVLLPNCLSG